MIGIISAFAAAISWTYACFIWRTQTKKFQSIEINIQKNIIAFVIFLPAFLTFNFSIELKQLIILLLSGVIGIGLGDTFYLKSLQIFGTRKTLTVEALSPLLAALSGEIFINENLSTNSWIGIFIISITLFLILNKKTEFRTKYSSSIEINNIISYGYPFLSVLCAVLGGLFSRIVFIETNLSPLLTTEIRLLGSIIFLLVFKGFRVNFYFQKLEKNQQKRFLLSILLGTNLGIFLQQIVFKTLPIGIGWTLLSTSPLISLFFAKKEERTISNETIFLTCLLFFGVSLIAI